MGLATLAPIIFVLLWSTGLVGAAPVVVDRLAWAIRSAAPRWGSS